jgi:hypothetical protein
VRSSVLAPDGHWIARIRARLYLTDHAESQFFIPLTIMRRTATNGSRTSQKKKLIMLIEFDMLSFIIGGASGSACI